MPTIHADDIAIAYEERGSGEPLVLVGGLTSTLEVFALQVPELSRVHRVITPDNRGSGRTRVAGDDGTRAIATFAADLRRLLDGLGIERAHVLGASMGGMIVQEFAATWPGRVASLVVACSTPFGLGHPLSDPPDPDAVAALTAPRAATPEEDEARTIRALAHPSSPAKRADRIAVYLDTKRTWPHSPEEISARGAAIAAWSVDDRLPTLRVPTLVLAGADDRLVKPANSRRVAERIPGAEFVAIPETAHLFFLEEPEETNRRILDFTRRHPIRPS